MEVRLKHLHTQRLSCGNPKREANTLHHSSYPVLVIMLFLNYALVTKAVHCPEEVKLLQIRLSLSLMAILSVIPHSFPGVIHIDRSLDTFLCAFICSIHA